MTASKKCSQTCPTLKIRSWKWLFGNKFIPETANSIKNVAKKPTERCKLCEKKVQKHVGEKKAIGPKKCKIAPPRHEKKLKKISF